MLPAADFDPLQTLYSGRQIIALALWGQVTGVTATAATDVIAKADHPFVDGQQVRFVSGTGFTGLTAGQIVFVVNTVAATSFKVSLTKGGAAIDITADGTVGVFERVSVFASEEIDEGGDQTVEELKLPGADGIIRTLRSALKEETEQFTFPTPEVRRLLEIFDGAKKGRKIGFCTIWEPDIDDEDGFVAMKSENFPCEVTREGTSKAGGGTFSRASLRIKSNKTSAVLWEADAAA